MRYFVTVHGRTFTVDLSGGAPRVDGEDVSAEMTTIPGTPVRHLLLEGRSYPLLGFAGERRGDWEVMIGHDRLALEVVDERTRTLREMTGTVEVDVRPVITAPMPGMVVRVEVEAGMAVRAGQGVVVVEAMKMENELKAPADAVVARVFVEPGQIVEKGATLVVFE
jgi:hypothetical protein